MQGFRGSSGCEPLADTCDGTESVGGVALNFRKRYARHLGKRVSGPEIQGAVDAGFGKVPSGLFLGMSNSSDHPRLAGRRFFVVAVMADGCGISGNDAAICSEPELCTESLRIVSSYMRVFLAETEPASRVNDMVFSHSGRCVVRSASVKPPTYRSPPAAFASSKQPSSPCRSSGAPKPVPAGSMPATG